MPQSEDERRKSIAKLREDMRTRNIVNWAVILIGFIGVGIYYAYQSLTGN